MTQHTTINPATGEKIMTYETMAPSEVMGILEDSRAAFLHWRGLPVSERACYLPRLAAALRDDSARYARLITLEMGKPITEARAEIEKCAWLCEVFAECAQEWLREEEVDADGRRHFVTFEPLGIILSVMPWNFPFWQALRFAVPTVVAGNTSMLKHASNVPQCAIAVEETFKAARFPPNVFRTILTDHETVAELVAHDVIQGVSLTGSTAVGARVAEAAGRNLKKVVLELGGSDPFIVLDDADVEIAARNAVKGRMVATGQSCIAAKRFIVMRSVADAFTKRFAALMRELVVGDPMDEKTQVGPIVDERSLLELEGQLRQAVESGAKVVAGGCRRPGKGYFFEPTVLTEVAAEMRVASEEVFGPIAPVIVVVTEEEAIRTANASPFGLGGSVWTKDLERGVRVARGIESGTLFINSIVKSDPRMPFGGVKKSGIGRELSQYGLREFVNVKGISVYDHL